MNADLHIHTRLSNGSLGLDEIIKLAKKREVSAISITDHDCPSGNARAKKIAQDNDIIFIPGCEISALDDGEGSPDNKPPISILCYSPDFPDRIEGLCNANKDARKKASSFLISEVCKKYTVSKDLIERCYQGSTSIFKQHIMHALVESGIAGSFYGDIHDEIFVPGGINHNPKIKPRYASASTVIEQIHNSGGIAILAHPAMYNDDTILDRMKKLGVDGIEVWHPSADKEMTEKLYSFANKQMLMTGGSDFHGLYNKGCNTIGSYGPNDASLSDFLKYKDRQKRAQKKAK